MTIIALVGIGYATGYRNGRAKTGREILLEELRTTSSQKEFSMQAVEADLRRFTRPENK